MVKQHEVVLLPKQIEALRYDGKIGFLRGGVGSGKTYVMCYWILQRMIAYPKGVHVIFAADYPQIRRGFMRTFRDVLDRLNIRYRYRDDIPTITLEKGGAKLEALSAEQAERVRSIEIDSLLMEEVTAWPNGKTMFETLMGRLRVSPKGKLYRDLQPKARGSFNPDAVGSWIWEKIEVDRAFPCWRFSTRENYLIPNHADYIDTLERSISPDRWSVEIDGHWGNAGGLVYKGYDPVAHVTAPHPSFPTPGVVSPHAAILWTLDFNVGYMSSLVAQQHEQAVMQDGYQTLTPQEIMARVPPKPHLVPIVQGWQRRVIIVHDEIRLEDAGTPDVLEEFLRRYGDIARTTGVILYGDAAGGARSQTMTSKSAVRSNWDIIVSGLQDAGIPVEPRIQTTNPAVMDRVNAFKDQLKTKAGYGLLVNPKCEHLIRDIMNVKFRPNSNEIDKRSAHETHMTDALGYLIWFESLVARGDGWIPNLQAFMYR